MRLPAVAIAAAFAVGITLGLHLLATPHVTSRFFLAVCFAALHPLGPHPLAHHLLELIREKKQCLPIRGLVASRNWTWWR
jgi:predicted deacetylase